MASESETETDFSSDPSPIETLPSNREIPLFLPFILISRRRESENQDDARDRIIIISPLTQTVVVLESSSPWGFDSLFDGKEGLRPASQASIEAMGSVDIERGDEQCVICLEEWEIGGKAKEMPCKHRFCGGCIEKWLRVHGSCPVCRHQMPAEEDGESDPKR